MKTRTSMWTANVFLLASLGITGMAAAQDNSSPLSPNNHHRHHQYKLIDIGTLGGPDAALYRPRFGRTVGACQCRQEH